MQEAEDEEDWQIDEQGFYVATRGFLIRRGYCCGNRCRNCPYLNWRNAPGWRPTPAATVQFAHVAPTILDAISARLTLHEQLQQPGDPDERERLIAHYRLLLERWER